MVEYPSSDGGKANDSICSASRVTGKGPRSISRFACCETTASHERRPEACGARLI
jgi:hypothetical protein